MGFALMLCTISYNVTASPKDIKETLHVLYNKYKNTHIGHNADYIPELSHIDPNLFGIVVMNVNGDFWAIGDTEVPFAIESISKPFVYALALQDNGNKLITDKVGLDATGHAFNSVIAIEESPHHIQNPLVNAGAIQTTSFIKGANSDEKWQRVLNFLQDLSDFKLYLGGSVYKSESRTNQHNRAIAELMKSYNLMLGNPYDALDRYTKACSIMVTARQLAIMGATLANHGINPLTHRQIIASQNVKHVLAEMVINGLYEHSGTWFWSVGLPAKSGVGGGLLAIVPNKMAIVVYSPPLDAEGNSVRGQMVIQELSEKWGLHILSGFYKLIHFAKAYYWTYDNQLSNTI